MPGKRCISLVPAFIIVRKLRRNLTFHGRWIPCQHWLCRLRPGCQIVSRLMAARTAARNQENRQIPFIKSSDRQPPCLAYSLFPAHATVVLRTEHFCSLHRHTLWFAPFPHQVSAHHGLRQISSTPKGRSWRCTSFQSSCVFWLAFFSDCDCT